MNKEHSNELLKLGKILYADKDKSSTETLMCFGFDCGDGWYYSLRDLTIKLEALNILYRNYNFQIKAFQVKEKFGTLRFYYHIIPTSDILSEEDGIVMNYVEQLVDNYIDDAEKRCENVCEECGKQFYDFNKNDRVITKGWIRILCKDCAEKLGNEYYTSEEEMKNDL